MAQESKSFIKSQNTSSSETGLVPNTVLRRVHVFLSKKRAMIIVFTVVFAIIGAATLLFVRAASPAGPITGPGGKCLDNKANRLKQGNPIQLYGCNKSAAQQWTITSNADGTSTIHLTNKYCLDVKYAGTTSKTPVWLWPCNGTIAQKWIINTNGSIVNPHANPALCLDDKYNHTADGNSIWVYTCNQTTAQKWVVPKNSPVPIPPTTPPTTTPPPPISGTGANNTGGSSTGSGSGSGSGTPSPSPTATCPLPKYPDATCTGVPASTALKAVNGDITITVAGTIIGGENINGCIEVRAPGVVIKDSKIHCNGIPIVLDAGALSGTPLVVEDSEINCQNSNGVAKDGGTAISGANFIAQRLNIYDCENGFDADDNATIQDNYVHDLYESATAHTDGLQSSNGSNLTINHNTFYSGPGSTSAININNSKSGPTTTNTTVSNNLLAGGAYTLYCPIPGDVNVKITGNHFSNIYFPKIGEYGPSSDCQNEIQSGNVYQESGQPLTFD